MKFKKGDKVKVYGLVNLERKPRNSTYPYTYLSGTEARVSHVVYPNSELTLKFNKKDFQIKLESYECEAHPMQCRKVKK